MTHDRPKQLPVAAIIADIAALMPDFSRAQFMGRGGSKTKPFESSRQDHGRGMKLARRIKTMSKNFPGNFR